MWTYTQAYPVTRKRAGTIFTLLCDKIMDGIKIDESGRQAFQRDGFLLVEPGSRVGSLHHVWPILMPVILKISRWNRQGAIWRIFLPHGLVVRFGFCFVGEDDNMRLGEGASASRICASFAGNNWNVESSVTLGIACSNM